ncbi:MAG TPA: peptidylprolyl isomerase [Gemmataceae bacterium]|nr:peptidylprolyl isomerase [Gemmataceae bacterium]
MIRRLFPGWLKAGRTAPIRRPDPARLRVETLEARDVPSVMLQAIADQAISSDKPIYIPITVTNTPAGAVTTTVSSGNTGLAASVVTGGRSISFTVKGKDSANQDFTGTITIRLFESAAPLATQRIIDLITQGYYNGKTFHRVADLFDGNPAVSPTNVIIQGGSPNGDGIGGSGEGDIVDEFNKDFTFASDGLVAMANAGDDGNDAQFFITDINRPLAERVQFLNFNHTIVGILTDGFDVFTKMKGTPVAPPNPPTNPLPGTTPLNPLTITGATVFTDDKNAVIKLAPSGAAFTGSSTIMVTANDGTGATTEQFVVNGVDDKINSRPFLGSFNHNLTTTTGQPVSFIVPATDIDGDPFVLAVKNSDPGKTDDFTTDPANLSFSIDQATGKITLTPAAGFTGTLTFKVGVRAATAADSTTNYDTDVVNLTVSSPPPPPPPSDVFAAEGSLAGAEPRVVVKNADGSQRFSVLAFEPSFTGGVRVAVADVTGDGKLDVIAVPGFGGSPVVKVLDGTDGHVLFTRMVFEDTFRGGLFLKVGDAQRLGYSQVYVGAGDSGGPRVTLLDVSRNQVLQNFFAGDKETRGGVSFDLGEVVPGRGPMLVVGGGPQSGPTVNVYDAKTGNQLGTFLAGDANDRAGIRVRIGPTVDTSFNAHPVFIAPYFSTGTDPEKPFNVVPFLS